MRRAYAPHTVTFNGLGARTESRQGVVAQTRLVELDGGADVGKAGAGDVKEQLKNMIDSCAMFDEPLPQADRHTLEICVAQCDVLMQRSEQRRGITAVVRSKLFRESGHFPTLPEVAAELDVHPRTLRRQLVERTSFRALLNEARSTLAVDLLCNVGLTVEEVSKRLGYTDTSTFCHAFKRWHGVPPARIRARARASATSRRPWRSRSRAGRHVASGRRR